MANKSSRDISIIKHITDYCDDIADILQEFDYDREIYNARKVYRNSLALCVLQIGELTVVLSDGFKETHSEVPWRNIKAMRNIIAHRYGSFDFDVLWEVVTMDIPQLKDFCKRKLDDKTLTDALNA